jgi:hypothetical protein
MDFDVNAPDYFVSRSGSGSVRVVAGFEPPRDGGTWSRIPESPCARCGAPVKITKPLCTHHWREVYGVALGATTVPDAEVVPGLPALGVFATKDFRYDRFVVPFDGAHIRADGSVEIVANARRSMAHFIQRAAVPNAVLMNSWSDACGEFVEDCPVWVCTPGVGGHGGRPSKIAIGKGHEILIGT